MSGVTRVDEASGIPPFSPVVALLTLSNLADRRVTAALAPHGLTVRKWGVLGHIAGSPGSSFSELARRSGITVQSVHTLIGGLIDQGLVLSEVGLNGQPARVSVTGEGRALLDAVAIEMSAIDAELFASPGMSALAEGLAAATEEWRRTRQA